eukprot:3776198-Prymnesium_polylepis.3
MYSKNRAPTAAERTVANRVGSGEPPSAMAPNATLSRVVWNTAGSTRARPSKGKSLANAACGLRWKAEARSNPCPAEVNCAAVSCATGAALSCTPGAAAVGSTGTSAGVRSGSGAGAAGVGCAMCGV